jgi:Flp pilus assembly protein TadD
LRAAAKRAIVLPRKAALGKADLTKKEGLFASAGKRNAIFCLLLIAATLALYNPVNRHPFVNYDDPSYITENPHVQASLTWGTVTWAFTSTEHSNWHPLTWLSHALDCQLFHLNPAGHHFTSLLIHAVNAAFLFLLLAWGTKRVGPSLFVAALLAFHPINVESVAWVAERKSVLSTFFFFLAITAYGWYAQRPNWRRYAAVFMAFALALMSKPMVITLPFVLALLDYWPLGRIRGSAPSAVSAAQTSIWKLLVEKIPLFALSVGSAIITMYAQQSGGAMRSTLQFPFAVRIENAIVAYAMYLWKMFWPAHLAPLYPHPGNSLPFWRMFVSLLVLANITVLVWQFGTNRRSHKNGETRGTPAKRYLLVGWLWFLGTLVPVIGLVQVGDAAMADRYGYIPLIGIFVMIAFGMSDLADARKVGVIPRLTAAACVLIALAFASDRQLSYWSSSYDLWAHTLTVTQNNYIAEDNFGGALVLLGKTNEAYPHFRAAALINPYDPMSHFNLGAYLQESGQLQDAIGQYQYTIHLTSDVGLLAGAYANQGSALRDLGQNDKARASYDEALRLNPRQFNAYLGLGHLLEKQGKQDEAISAYSQSVAIRPTDEGYFALGQVLEAARRNEEAAAAYRAAVKINPDAKEARQALDALNPAQH